MMQYYVALELMLGNSGTKLPAQCMLGRRGEFEGLASMLPLCCVTTETRAQLSLGLADRTQLLMVHTRNLCP